MSNIAISDPNSAGFDRLSGSDSYMRELSDEELNAQKGGIAPIFWLGVGVGAIAGGLLDGFLEWLLN